jgi:hypothetical protein
LPQTSIFVLTRQELFDYTKCPRIVALKMYKQYVMPQPPKAPAQQRTQPAILPNILSSIGEAGFEAEFDDEIPRAKKEKALLNELTKRGIEIDEEIRSAVRETTKGFEQTRVDVEKAFGNLEIIGRGETKYGEATQHGLCLPTCMSVHNRFFRST